MNKKSFFMVYAENQQAPKFIHEEMNFAEAEAKRLAEQLGVKTFVLASIKSFECVKFKTEDCRPTDDLPF